MLAWSYMDRAKYMKNILLSKKELLILSCFHNQSGKTVRGHSLLWAKRLSPYIYCHDYRHFWGKYFAALKATVNIHIIHELHPILLIVWCDNLGVPTRSNNPDWVQDMFGEQFVQAVTDRVTFAVQHFDGQVRSRGWWPNDGESSNKNSLGGR